jgi:murein DD-endopeptidase MepM/ murein hydrolase activator NlpD
MTALAWLCVVAAPALSNGRAEPNRGTLKRWGAQNPRPDPIRFRWPTWGRRIVKGYGEQTDPKTGLVRLNPGINIASVKGSGVVAAGEGRVALIAWLPGYGTIIIVQHRDGYRTVYGNLATATVVRGARVKAGEKIGTIGMALGGAFLHFEVWRDQTRLNPMDILP